jgi:hypothetical protein
MTIHTYADQEALKPSDLAVAPLQIQFCGGEYSYISQTRPMLPGTDPIMYTGGGTQTYDYKGKPSDNDND